MLPTVSITTTNAITKKMQLYVEGEDNKWSGFEGEAKSIGGLPILVDLFTAFFVRPDGELFSLDIETEGSEPQVEQDLRTRVTVINAASEWFPELKSLSPPRSDTARDCLDCDGRGKLSVVDYLGKPFLVPCPKCMSLGWV